MKREYKQPQTLCIDVQLQQMIALSADGTTDQEGGNLSRRRSERQRHHSQWDDDYDDEDYDY